MNQELDIQGHRGCRGWMPENTLAAFERAIKDYDVTTLEMDVCISKDHQVVVSHEPFFNHEITQGVNEKDEKNHNLYTLDYDSIKTYDVGSRVNPRFPDQLKTTAHKPLLSDVIDQSDHLNPSILYNIEIKRVEGQDLIFHPEYKTFADLVVKLIRDKQVADRTTVQSFDLKTLRYIHTTYPDIKLVLLVEYSKDVRRNYDLLGFFTEVYSPYYKLLSPEDIRFCHGQGVKVIPWTLNEESDIKKYIEMGCDGIISDFPDRVNKVYAELKK